MPTSTAVRLGGVCGLISALVLIPALLVGLPDRPDTLAGADAYFHDNSRFILFNGTIPLLQVPTFIIFIVVLGSRLHDAESRNELLRRVAIAGGVVYVALSAVGKVAEVAYPATIVRFSDASVDPQLKRLLLATASWCYHYGQVAVATAAGAVAIAVWRNRVLPSWVAAVSGLLAVAAAVHVWLPLPAAIATLVWVAAMSLAMLASPAQRAAEPVP
jgi:hypothetical protein